MSSTMLHVRIDENVKEQAANTLASMGLTIPDAVRVFLMRVIADKALPFTVSATSIPNMESQAAIAETNEIIKKRNPRFKKAEDLFDDLEKNSGK